MTLALTTPLFVPADRPERFQKAASSGADAVILDLEDAVTPANKTIARTAIAAHGITQVPVVIRINPLDSPHVADDLAALGRTTFAAIMVAKAADPAALARLAQRCPGTPLIALIESAAGHAAARAIAAAPQVAQLAFGSIDYALDLGCEETFEALLAARSKVVLASRLADRAPPLDSVTIGHDDAAQLMEEARRARTLGFGGKLLIHPKQIAPVRAGLRPSEADIDFARRVVAAAARQGEGAISLDGRMIDAPVLARARRIVSQSG